MNPKGHLKSLPIGRKPGSPNKITRELREMILRARGVAILRPTQPTTRLQPHPAVTCASCQHQQQQPDTSDAAGMHGCG